MHCKLLTSPFIKKSCYINSCTYLFISISPLFNKVGQLRTSSHLQLRPGQDKAKQCDTNNRVTHGINKRTVNNPIEKDIYSVCKCSKIREVRQ